MGQEFVITNEHTLKHTLANIEKLYKEKGYVKLKASTARQRTLTQNAALHKWCDLMAQELNDKGLDMRLVLSHHAEIPWSGHEVKERLWRPVQLSVLGKESTTEADRQQYTEVYEVLNRHFGERFGLHVGWPVKDQVELREVS